MRTMLATYCTLSKDNAPTPEEMRQKSREYMLMKPREKEEVIAATEKKQKLWYAFRDNDGN